MICCVHILHIKYVHRFNLGLSHVTACKIYTIVGIQRFMSIFLFFGRRAAVGIFIVWFASKKEQNETENWRICHLNEMLGMENVNIY